MHRDKDNSYDTILLTTDKREEGRKPFDHETVHKQGSSQKSLSQVTRTPIKHVLDFLLHRTLLLQISKSSFGNALAFSWAVQWRLTQRDMNDVQVIMCNCCCGYLSEFPICFYWETSFIA